MIDGLVVSCVKVSSPLGVAKIGKVDDVRDRAAGCSGAVALLLARGTKSANALKAGVKMGSL